LFRSELQVRLLALLLLQPEREWSLAELSDVLDAPTSSVHRELGRAEAAGIVEREARMRPHRFRAATQDSLYGPLAALLRQTVGVEEELRKRLDRDDVEAALIHGSWASGRRRPDSDIDVLVVGRADLRALRKVLRPVGEAAGRRIDLTLLSRAELDDLVARGGSFARGLLDGPVVPLLGDLRLVHR